MGQADFFMSEISVRGTKVCPLFEISQANQVLAEGFTVAKLKADKLEWQSSSVQQRKKSLIKFCKKVYEMGTN